jgi:hypothetical protein
MIPKWIWMCGLVGMGCLTWWAIVRYGLLIPSLGTLRNAPLISPKDLSSGDVIFMSGSSWTEKTIQTLTDSPFSHVGLIVAEGDLRYVWEADVSGTQKKGPRMVDLAAKLREWPGSKEVYVKKLLPGVGKLDQPTLTALGKLVGDPFDSSMLAWVFPDWERWVAITKTHRSWFCSELVVETLKLMGVPIQGKGRGYAPGRVWDIPFLGEPQRLLGPT